MSFCVLQSTVICMCLFAFCCTLLVLDRIKVHGTVNQYDLWTAFEDLHRSQYWIYSRCILTFIKYEYTLERGLKMNLYFNLCSHLRDAHVGIICKYTTSFKGSSLLLNETCALTEIFVNLSDINSL